MKNIFPTTSIREGWWRSKRVGDEMKKNNTVDFSALCILSSLVLNYARTCNTFGMGFNSWWNQIDPKTCTVTCSDQSRISQTVQKSFLQLCPWSFCKFLDICHEFSFFHINQVDPQNTRLYAYQMNSYRYLYTSPRILLAPALFLLAGGFLQYIIQRSRVRSSSFEKEIFVFSSS